MIVSCPCPQAESVFCIAFRCLAIPRDGRMRDVGHNLEGRCSDRSFRESSDVIRAGLLSCVPQRGALSGSLPAMFCGVLRGHQPAASSEKFGGRGGARCGRPFPTGRAAEGGSRPPRSAERLPPAARATAACRCDLSMRSFCMCPSRIGRALVTRASVVCVCVCVICRSRLPPTLCRIASPCGFGIIFESLGPDGGEKNTGEATSQCKALHVLPSTFASLRLGSVWLK